MLKVDNKEIIKKVSIRSLKQNITTNSEIVNNTWHISNKDYEAKRATATAA